MKRSGFTMIELIFVIVILGILAAVAIPKLAATRDDAQVAKGATQLATAVSDIGAYYTSQGVLTKFVDMSNVAVDDNTVDLNTSGSTVTLASPAECISITSSASISGSGSDTINIKYTNAGATPVCKGIAAAAYAILGQTDSSIPTADENATRKFGGSKVSF